MISYGSGLPGGIFLPILCLGGLIGAIVGSIAVNLRLDESILFLKLYTLWGWPVILPQLVRHPLRRF